MGSEQSQQPNIPSRANTTSGRTRSRLNSSGNTKLQRGNTIAVTGQMNRLDDASPSMHPDRRPVSPPISVCSDSDLPYISYTDKPIGDSPKYRNKGQSSVRHLRSTVHEPLKKQTVTKKRPNAHDIVVVRAAPKDRTEMDPDLQRLQSIPQFLPVMRGTLSLPANRDPEVLERLQPVHLINMCHRMQTHLNSCSSKIAAEQQQLSIKIKEIDNETTKVLQQMVEKQKLYASYAEQFSKVKGISHQLSRCNMLLNQNIESMEMLNNLLDIDDRLEPFLWKTS